MAKRRLLIIEDDADVAEMLRLYFSGQGYDVLHSMTGGDGINLARAKFPNLILLDVMLPDMDGFDVCRVLRTATLTRYIPITFLTQRDHRNDKIAGLELGADDYITKPFDVEELRLRVQGSIRRSTRETLQDTRTGLPLGAMVDEMRQYVQDKPEWTILEIGLAGLNAFRDLYGFIAADEALVYAAQVITQAVSTHGTPEDFVGTPGEDKFVVFTRAADIQPMLTALATTFKEGVKKYYNFADSERGFSVVTNSDGESREVPLMYLALPSLPERTQA